MFDDRFRTASTPGTGRWGETLDLQLTATLTVLTAAVLAVPVSQPPLLRVVVGLPLLLFLPGYALTAALFPARAMPGGKTIAPSDHRALSSVARIVVSVVTSVALVGAAAILAGAAVSISVLPVLTSIVGMTLVGTLVAYGQRQRVPEERRFTPFQRLSGGTILTIPSTLTGQALVIVAVLALAVVGASGAMAVGANGDGVREFYVGGPTENGTIAMDGQATSVTAGNGTTQYLVVQHRNLAAANYTVVARLAGPDIGVGGTDDATEIGRYGIAVETTGYVVQPVDIRPESAGENVRVEYLLYDGPVPPSPSRESALRSLTVDLTVEEG